MIFKSQTIGNNHVTLIYSEADNMVAIFKENHTHWPVRTYAGIDDLADKFLELWESFTEDITVDYAIEFFHPNYLQTLIN